MLRRVYLSSVGYEILEQSAFVFFDNVVDYSRSRTREKMDSSWNSEIISFPFSARFVDIYNEKLAASFAYDRSHIYALFFADAHI